MGYELSVEWVMPKNGVPKTHPRERAFGKAGTESYHTSFATRTSIMPEIRHPSTLENSTDDRTGRYARTGCELSARWGAPMLVFGNFRV